jgi:prevent-host-death family protein
MWYIISVHFKEENMEAKIIPVTALRPKLLGCVSKASRLGQDYIITKNGRPSAVLVGFDEWESWKETMEILSDTAALKRIRKNRAYFARGGKGKNIAQTFK